jgi:F0F1-type ATP synthase delta subunit
MAQARIPRRALARLMAEKLTGGPAERQHWIQALAAYIVTHNMIEQVDALVNDIAVEIFRQKGILDVSVVSARPLTDTIRSVLVAELQQQTNAQQVVLHESTDASLLGGLVARTPEGELDISVRTKLKQLAALA